MPRSDPPAAAWKAHAVVGLSLLAPVLAGTTELWSMAALMALTGALFLVAPPRHALPVLPTLLLLVLFLLALSAFLPASLSSFPAWRLDLIKLGADLPSTRSPQPWLSLQWSALLLFTILWSYYLLTFEWHRQSRETALVAYAIGMLALGATFITAHILKQQIPFWPDTPEFGFFPNRNQTSNVFGLAGIVIYAIGLHRLQERRSTWWVWLCSLSLICWALILNYSRAGILLFFGGALAWHAWWVLRSRERRGPAIALCALALLVALLFLNGGKTLDRFQGENLGLVSPGQSGRIQIFRDAFHFTGEQPILGSGLGNFRSLFSTARNYSTSASEAVHPESDWLWGAVDLGWGAPLLVLFLIVWWLGRCFPFASGTARPLRVAAMICGLAFVVHGFFDVSAHRLGALWPALFLASLALCPGRDLADSRLVAPLFRIFGVLLLVISSWWFSSILGETALPTSATISFLEHETETATARSNYEAVLQRATTGLRAAPLDWLLYYHRGVAEAALFRPRPEALRDFAIARYLFPHWADLYLKEGQTWLELGEPDLAFDIWNQGMERLGANAPVLYNGIFALVRDDAALRDRWRDLAGNNPRCQITFLGNASSAEFELQVTNLLTSDPQLKAFSTRELQSLFQFWYERGNKLSMLEILRDHPAWQDIAWRETARAYADYQDYRPAYETAARFTPPPTLPNVDPAAVDSLAARFQAGHDVGHDGFILATAQLKAGAVDEALRTINIASAAPKAPRGLSFLAAQIWADKGDWKKAWEELRKYADL